MGTPFLFAAYELSGTGASKDYVGITMGRFEFMPGEDYDGSPVYKQAHSKEIATHLGIIILYRWESPFLSYLILPTTGLRASGLYGYWITI